MGDVAIVLIVVLVLVLLWRGPRTLPRLGEALGRGVREARDAARFRGDANGRADDATAADHRPPEDDRRV